MKSRKSRLTKEERFKIQKKLRRDNSDIVPNVEFDKQGPGEYTWWEDI